MEPQIKKSNYLNQNETKQFEQQIISLGQKNEELQNKLVNSFNNLTNNNSQITRIIKEKNDLIKENIDLKNELENLNNSIKELENNNFIQKNQFSELEKQLLKAKKEIELNYNQLKLKENENEKLLNIIKNNQKDNSKIKNTQGNFENAENNHFNRENNINLYNNEEFEKLKKDIEEKNKQIILLEKEIGNHRNINSIFLENTQSKEKNQLIQNGKVEIQKNLGNLERELNDKELQIQKLIKENNILRNILKINNINNEEEHINDNKYIHNPFRATVNSVELNHAEKIKLYKDQIKEYKMMNESDSIQIKALKADIKMLKIKIKNLETFGGKMKDINEFISVFNLALINYKPKKGTKRCFEQNN